MSGGFANDPHTERGSECPKNRFGLTDYCLLQPVERTFVLRRAVQLEATPEPGNFDIPHLKSIHRFLFQDVFPWAGDFRVVTISKGNSPFAPWQHIESSLADLLARLRQEQFLCGIDAAALIARSAFYLGELNAIHPFREGNGRTQREFIRQLALGAGHPLSWAGFTQQQMTDASIQSHLKGDHSALASILKAALFSSRKSIATT